MVQRSTGRPCPFLEGPFSSIERVSSKRLGIAAIALLVVLNAVLIGLLVMKSRDARTAEAAPPPPAPAGPSEPADATPTPEPAPRLLHALDATTAVRATSGTCGTPGTLELSTDGGASWTALPNELGPVTRLSGSAPASLAVVGGDAACASAVRVSADAGATWGPGDAPETYWHLLPADRATLQTPTGQVPVPCGTEPLGLATDGADRGAVLCPDGAVHASTDGGRTWAQSAAVPGAVAIGVRDGGYLLGVEDPACTGVGVVRLDGAGVLDAQAAGCAPVTAAQVALAGAGDAVWLWAGEETRVSADGGLTW